MTSDPLPPDLLAMERELAARLQPEPAAELRSRVLAAVGREGHRRLMPQARLSFAQFAAATAAAALLAMNLAASVANDTDWRLRPTGPDPSRVADRVRGLAPELPEEEVRRQVLLVRVAAGLTMTPALAAGQTLEFRRFDRWDMP